MGINGSIPKTLSNKELEQMLEALDLYFLFNYDINSFFSKELDEIKLMLDLRSEILKRCGVIGD